MSMGFCGTIVLFAEDSETVLFRYSGENWNDFSDRRGSLKDLDGEILLCKTCLPEPIIHTRIRKTPSHHKKLVTKRIIQAFDVENAIENGYIEILKPCLSETSAGFGLDKLFFAKKLLWKVSQEYQECGMIPQKCVFYV